MKKKLTTLLLVLLLTLGVAVMLYPTVSDYYNSFHQSRAIANYAEQVQNLDAEVYEKLWADARAYNATLVDKENPLYMGEEEREVYNSLLNYTGDGILGYIEIPKINCELPIYHSTNESVLQIAIGHIEGTSLPVGGPSTHCVLSGHRGLPSAKLFTHLDQMEVGDTFVLQVLNETLTYQVDQIHIVLPNELDDIYIQPGLDLCTLVTCTPYGINSHRMLVRGHRVANAEEAVVIRVTADALRVEPLIVAPVAAVPMLLLLLIWLFTSPGGGKARPIRPRKRPPGGRRLQPKTEERRDAP